MMPYSIGLILDNINNYGIVKADSVFEFVTSNHTFVNDVMEPEDWMFKPEKFQRRTFHVSDTPRVITKKERNRKPKSIRLEKSKKHKGKIKKCHKIKHKFKMPKKWKKMMVPLLLGLLVAKIILIPLILKALGIVAIKGLLMGLFSTVLASLLGLKNIFAHSQGHHRKNEGYTHVDVLKFPSKRENHVYYDDHIYKRDDGPIYDDEWF